MSDSEMVSLVLTGIFGLVSSLGVLYQIIDIRRRSQVAAAEAGAGGPIDMPARPVPAAGPSSWPAPTTPAPAPPASWPAPEPPTTRMPPYQGPSAPPPPYQVPPVPPGPYQVPPVQPPHQPGPVPAVPVQPPGSPAPWPGQVYGPPRLPRAVLRARLLMVVLSLFTAISVALVLYSSRVEYSDRSEDDSVLITIFAYGVLFLIIATPLSTVPPVLSALIGRGREWARITTIVFLFSQAACCSCFGVVVPFAPASTDNGANGEKAVVGDALIGVFGILVGVASVAAAILLLNSESRNYFRAMTQWRAATGRR